MKVTLRKRNQGGKTWLYLDYYESGKRRTETLKLFLFPKPKTQLEKQHNKETLQLAQSIEAQRILEIQSGEFGFHNKNKLNGSFDAYLGNLKSKRRNSPGNYGNWDSMIKHLKDYHPSDIQFKDLNKEFVVGFKEFLDKVEIGFEKKLSQNSKYSYFNKFRSALKLLVLDNTLMSNPAKGVDPFKQGETERQFLSLEEVRTLANTECEIPLLKNAFLFSCLTGLRWSDMEKLIWSEVQHSELMGYFIRFRQKKTKAVETLNISDQAYALLGERKDSDIKVFDGLKYSAWYNLKLQQWVIKAGITRKITFHCARHTYATLQLTAGTDIYTVSKLLGHRELKTTQIYAKVIDDRKKEAADRIKI